jgi:threonine synthase
MGLPVARFVVATNANDEVPRFLATGRYEKIVPSLKCISNAMNVGHPSNLARIVDLYGGWMDEQGILKAQPDLAAMRRDLFAVSIDDDLTRQHHRHHPPRPRRPAGAARRGRLGRAAGLPGRPSRARRTPAISLETAHPAKFPEEIRALIGSTRPAGLPAAAWTSSPSITASWRPTTRPSRTS